MAAEIVASAFLGALFKTLLQKVKYGKFLDFCRTAKVHTEAVKVVKLLQTLEMVLDDAEEKQFEYPAVKVWIDDLRDVSYDLEVILDEFDTYELQKEIRIDVGKLKFKWQFKSQVKKIAGRLQDIRHRMEVLHLKPVYGVRRSSERLRKERETISDLTDDGLFVRDAQKQKLIDLVKNAASSSSSSNSGDSKRRRVIAVVGTGGMGKTTLAQRVYHDDQLSGSFNMKAWVCISDQFQLMTIMENIHREIGSDFSVSKSLQELGKKIEKVIVDKTLLLFLDDAWERDHTQWEKMWYYLHADAAKQIIVVLTTRDQKVASSSGALPDDHFLLDKLSDEDCFSVFQHYAFKDKDIDAYPMLKDIGVEIVKKCDGSPLAAKVLGGILQSKSTLLEWENILHSKLLAENKSINSILMLSYLHLHMPLKRCFAYVAVFPKDYEFEEQEIVLLWIAQGFLQHSNQTELEDVGRDYFHDLLSKSFFQPSPSNTGLFVMHDLIHDLAQEISGETCFRLEKMTGADQIHNLSTTARYASYTRCKHEVVEKIKTFGKAHSLQTFVHVEGEGAYDQVFSYPLIDDTLCKLSHLRVLSLRSCRAIYELPHPVTKLKYLRYLDFSYSDIEVLQDSICTLVNLQTLLLKDCCYLVKLPDDLSDLVNIRHLDISGSTRVTEMPFGLNNLKSLRTLSNFVVGENIRCGIQQLNCLNQIKGSLCISDLQNVTIPGDASQAMLEEKLELRTLTMRWRNSNNDSNYFSKIIEDVLEELRPPQQLEELTIENFMGTKFPKWMGDSSFSNITSLNLSFCEKCMCLPPLGKLPALEHLHIKAFKAIVTVDSDFCGEFFSESFSSLETLIFEEMSQWKHWFISDEVKIFPRLKMLSILKCPRFLGKLPEQLLELEELVIQYCKSLVASIPSTSKLQRLKIDRCKEVTCNNLNDLSSLNSLILKNIEALNIPEELKLKLKELEELETDCLELMPHLSQHPTTITRMCLLKYSELKEMPCKLENLRLENCSFEKIPQILPAKDSSFSLKVLRCPNLISFPNEINFSNNNNGHYSNSTVFIEVEDCRALAYIPVFKMQDRCSLLVDVKIKKCDSLTGFARGLLPHTLRRLELSNCKKLRCLVVGEEEEENKSNSDMLLRCPSIQLDELTISNCDYLKYLASSITRGELPFRVKRLHISDCKNLKSLIKPALASSSSPLLQEVPEELESLDILWCPGLKEVAESFHINNSLNALQSIRIYGCRSLKCLPKGLHNINTLKEFSVARCEILEAPSGGIVNDVVDNNPALKTLRIVEWPAGNASLLNNGFQRTHTSLTTLEITYPNNKNTSLESWGLSRLVSLQRLCFKGDLSSDVVYFPKTISSALPSSSLTQLSIDGFINLKYLSCHVFKNLGSLEQLILIGCSKLESFPKEGLPRSLLRVQIAGCPKLEERYDNKKKMKAKDWSKISHIPHIEIMVKEIQEIWLENNER